MYSAWSSGLLWLLQSWRTPCRLTDMTLTAQCRGSLTAKSQLTRPILLSHRATTQQVVGLLSSLEMGTLDISVVGVADIATDLASEESSTVALYQVVIAFADISWPVNVFALIVASGEYRIILQSRMSDQSLAAMIWKEHCAAFGCEERALKAKIASSCIICQRISTYRAFPRRCRAQT